MTGERLKLVTDFSSLKPGDLVVIKPCPCGMEHRGLLTSECAGCTFNPRGLTFARRLSCGAAWLCACSVVASRVYVVDTGVKQRTTRKTAKPKALERTR